MAHTTHWNTHALVQNTHARTHTHTHTHRGEVGKRDHICESGSITPLLCVYIITSQPMWVPIGQYQSFLSAIGQCLSCFSLVSINIVFSAIGQCQSFLSPIGQYQSFLSPIGQYESFLSPIGQYQSCFQKPISCGDVTGVLWCKTGNNHYGCFHTLLSSLSLSLSLSISLWPSLSLTLTHTHTHIHTF